MKLSRIVLTALALAAVTAAAQLLPAQAGKAGSLVPDWGQYRGPKRDGLSPDTGLLKQWPGSGPPLAWKATGLGAAFSSVSVAGKHVYTMGTVGDANGPACLIALNAADGKILWKAPVGDKGGNNGAGPRSTPATDGSLVFGLGQEGTLVCVQAATGREFWRKNLKGFGGEMMSGWGYSESPLVDGPFLVCTPGGTKGTVIALLKTTGSPAWQSAELKEKAGYSSLVPVEIGGLKQYIVLAEKSVAGIAAANGRMAWRGDRALTVNPTAVAATPVYGDGIVFVTSSYGAGCNAFRVAGAGGRFQVQEAYKGMQLANHHGGVVLVGEHVYGTDDGALKCIELKTGKVVWQDRCVGKGSIAYADGLLIVRSETGPVALVEATLEGYKEKGRFNQPDRSSLNSWPHPVVFGGKLYLRDQDVLLCYDVKAK